MSIEGMVLVTGLAWSISLAFDPFPFIAWAPLGLGSLGAFFYGFYLYRNYKIVVNTPVTRVRSAAMGPVKIRGKARSDELVPTPFGKMPCCFCKIRIEIWEIYRDQEGRSKGDWKELRTAFCGSRFFVGDETGDILIDAPKLFDVDVEQTFERVVNKTFPPLVEYEQNFPLQDDDQQNGDAETAGKAPKGDPNYRLLEWSVLPGERYQVTGSCIENPDSQAPAERCLVSDGEGMPFAISRIGKEKESGAIAVALIVVGAIVFLIFVVALTQEFSFR